MVYAQGLSTLKKLKVLSIQSNRITKLEGLEDLEDLEEFYISHNGLSKIEGLEKNVSLRVWRVTRMLTGLNSSSCARWTLVETASRRSRGCRICRSWRSSG